MDSPPDKDRALKELYELSNKALPRYSRSPEFEEVLYAWLRLPRPPRNAVHLDEYDIAWWMFFAMAFNGGPSEMQEYLERSTDPRARDALELLHSVVDGPPPQGPVAPFYLSNWGWTQHMLRQEKNNG